MNGNFLKGKRTIKEAKMQMLLGAKNVKLILKKLMKISNCFCPSMIVFYDTTTTSKNIFDLNLFDYYFLNL